MELITLQGNLVRLEPLSVHHLRGLLEAAQLDQSTYSLTSVPTTETAMKSYLETAINNPLQMPFATIDTRVNRVVGSTRFALEFWAWENLLSRAPNPDAVEIGWTWLAKDAQRSGINTEAKLLMLTHAFETWQVHRVTLKTDARNMRSRNAIERLGAKFDGVLRAAVPASDGGIRDSAYFSILASEWGAVKTRLSNFLVRG
jgi:RimJ/RimL family protein N-acetyltransferase